MSTPIERLDRAFAAARDATGPEFFRRFRVYQELLEEDQTIAEAVTGMAIRVTDAQAELADEDEGRIAELVAIRRELVERDPQLDDSCQPHPPGTLLDMPARGRFLDWQWTLSNFDAIADDTGQGIFQRSGFDGSRARMLGEILRAKLHALQFRPGRIATNRHDLDDLAARVSAVVGAHQAQQERVDDLAESSGFLASRRIESLASYLRPRHFAAVKRLTEEQERERAEAVLEEVGGELHHLRNAVRPEEVRGRLTADQEMAVARYEEGGRRDLTALHHALQPVVEAVEEANAPGGWAALDTNQKLTAVGLTIALFTAIATVVAIIAN